MGRAQHTFKKRKFQGNRFKKVILSKSSDNDNLNLLNPETPKSTPTSFGEAKYRMAENEGKIDTFKPKNSLPVAVMDAIRPIYRDLINPSLLRKCLHGKTQNVNESFNNVVWTRIPKGTFVGKKTLEIGVWDSILTFNDGNVERLHTLIQLGLKDLGKYTVEGLHKFDVERLRKADKAAEEKTKEARIKKRRQQIDEEEMENDYYCPGGF